MLNIRGYKSSTQTKKVPSKTRVAGTGEVFSENLLVQKFLSIVFRVGILYGEDNRSWLTKTILETGSHEKLCFCLL